MDFVNFFPLLTHQNVSMLLRLRAIKKNMIVKLLFFCAFLVVVLTEGGTGIQLGAEHVETLSVVVEPDVPRANLEIPSSRGKMEIIFKNVKPGTQYDLKLSYPGTTPTQFLFLKPGEYVYPSGHRRRLLDTEKYGFRSDENGKDGGDDRIILMTQRRGVSFDPLIESRPVRFNLVLETLYFGIPFDAYKLIALVVLGVIFAIKILKPMLRDLLLESRYGETYNRSR